MIPLRLRSLGNPIMLVSDNPSLPGGLARVCRDLACLAATLPEYRVAVLGRGEGNRRKLPFTLYPYPESGGWGEGYLEGAWRDFAGPDHGIIMTLDDVSRRMQFALNDGQFLGSLRTFRKIGYFPVDGTGPEGDSLPHGERAVLAGYDKVLASSEWGRNVLMNSGRRDADWLPHGIDGGIFRPVPKARGTLGWSADSVVLGCVMANQARKDFPVAFHTLRLLRDQLGARVRMWLHTDAEIRYWNVYALAVDYGVSNAIELTTNTTDEQLALRYSGCDCTILPSAGEGFGFPIAESLACGTPCVTTDYAAGQELVEESARVAPVTFRVDTAHNIRRAVLSAHGFARAIAEQIEKIRDDREYHAERLSASVDHLRWSNLRWLWEKMFRSFLRG